MKFLYTQPRFYYGLAVLIMLFILSFFFKPLYTVAWISVVVFSSLVIADIWLLFGTKKGIVASRSTPERLSNGDENFISVRVENAYFFKTYIRIIDELPFQFQKRDFIISKKLAAKTADHLVYSLRPTERGEYHFGFLNIYSASPLRLLSKRYGFNHEQMVATYPSFLQMRKYELIAIHNKLHLYGLKKIRRIGHTTEFEHIKEYTKGDDIRTINWKATAKRGHLMINQYQDEKSQNVYMIIDKGRVMKMPFNGLSLLDCAINSTLILSNIIIKKYDKAGLFTFSKKVENRLKPDNKPVQIQKFLETLYKVPTDFFESDYSKLYTEVRQNIKQRSLLILYTNFETMDSLHRQLPYLKSITHQHLLVVVFFKNTELDALAKSTPKNTQEIYDKVIAEKLHYEKRLIVQELRKYGIYAVLTSPEGLTMDVINKYLELKARGLI